MSIMNEESTIATMQKDIENIDEKLDTLIVKVDVITKEMLCKADASDKYATKIDFEKMKSRVNFYAWIVPILTGALGVLATYVILK